MMTGFVSVRGQALTAGQASGEVLWAAEALSFWGGIAPGGRVIDRHHPLHGHDVAGRILCVPGGRGSCSGSVALLEMIMAGTAPAGIVVCDGEAILPLGVVIAELIFGRSLPVLRISPADLAALGGLAWAVIDGDSLTAGPVPPPAKAGNPRPPEAEREPRLRLSPFDADCLSGAYGPARALAMQAVVRTAAIMGARELVDVSGVHVDACIYTGPAGLAVAEKLVALGARFAVPTTLNALSVDQRRWRSLNCPPALAEPASRLADLYVAMGAERSFTCAPYLLSKRPQMGDRIAWAESNAVVFANSILGARTLKTPDLLDVMIGLTGRAPLCGPYLDAERRPKLQISLPSFVDADDSLYPLAGYLVGQLAGPHIPLVLGLHDPSPNDDHMKAFGAAFATLSGAAMFHVAGVTPEAHAGLDVDLPLLRVDREEVVRAFQSLDGADREEVDLVALGNPHLSVSELSRIAQLCHGRVRHPFTALVLTASRETTARAEAQGALAPIRAFGGEILNDTCWCMIQEPVIPATSRTIMTNSGKFAHYGPGLTGRGLRFGSLQACIDAAATGRVPKRLPRWLDAPHPAV